MADNSNNISTQVLTVDVGGAINNVKDYKQHIEDLKGTLLGLEKGTDEYNNVAKELRDSQQKLNEVMDVAKGKGDAVEGSYDNLSQTMSKLKKEFKATGDAAERARLATQINDINNQLKDMDASVGVFSRNVGNYANAFEDAFRNVLGEISNVDGAVGDLAKNTTQMIPLIKKVNSTALAGLSGIKKAIAATGIGLLIIAVGELVAHFDALRRAVGVTDEQFETFKTDALNVLENIVAGVVGVGNAILQFLLSPIKANIEAIKSLGTVIKDVFTGNWDAIKSDAKRGIDGINEALNKGIQFKDNFGVGKEFAHNLIANIKSEVDKETSSSGGVKVKVKVEPELKDVDLSKLDSFIDPAIKARVEAEKKALKEQEELNALSAELDKEAYDAALDALDDFNEQFIKSIIDEREKEKKLLEERRNNIQSFASSTADIIGTVADAWESNIKSQIETGKISEQEGKKQFERVKALQTAVAIINTISAGVAAFKGITEATGGWGLAAAIATMVATIGTGMAQVAKIQSTTLGTRSTQVTSVGTPNLGSIVNDYQPSYVTNVTNQTEMDNLTNALTKNPIKAYVVESDVTSAQELAQQRSNEASF